MTMNKKFEDGHFYSTIPSKQDIDSHSPESIDQVISKIDINIAGQKELLDKYCSLFPNYFFPADKSPQCRYYYNNGFFNISDSFFYFCFLHTVRPKKIIEVGSGFSSALSLDTAKSIENYNPSFTFIEPYPQRLYNLISNEDKKSTKIIESKVQDVDLDLFSELEEGDLLFIDSSHVSKYGSDLNHILFNIIPLLKRGTYVHFHDIFSNFEYPDHWLQQGRYWNENYLLRAFLTNNSQWKIHFFNRFVHEYFNETIQTKITPLSNNPGGSLYIHKN